MIRIQIELRALEDDHPAAAAFAYAAGWRIDDDFWWVRPAHWFEPQNEDADFPGGCFYVQRHIFAPGAAAALAFDAWAKEKQK